MVAELRTQLAAQHKELQAKDKELQAKDKELKLRRQKPVSTSLILDPIAMTQFSLDNDC